MVNLNLDLIDSSIHFAKRSSHRYGVFADSSVQEKQRIQACDTKEKKRTANGASKQASSQSFMVQHFAIDEV
jgi:hypothetical protein